MESVDSTSRLKKIKNAKKIASSVLSAAFLLSLIALGAGGCKSADPCPKNPSAGNLGSNVNSKADDYITTSSGNRMYFTTKRDKKKEAVWYSDLSGDEFSPAIPAEELKLAGFMNISTPSVYINPADGVEEVLFSAVTPKNRNNKEIFFTRIINGKMSEPKPVKELNSPEFDSHPVFSPDGSYVVFSSSREGGMGGVDLYFAKRIDKNHWSAPVNLGPGINTPEDDITPCIAPDNTLYFASKGYSTGSGFDLVRADFDGKTAWRNPKLLPVPINSDADETGPSIVGNNLCFGSRRAGGCGGFDLYSFPLCGPVIVSGRVKSNGVVKDPGKVDLLDSKGNSVSETVPDNNGAFNFRVTAGRKYALRYSNMCLPAKVRDIEFTAPCSDSSTIKLTAEFVLPRELGAYDFDEFKVPFFVTGYYMPNTTRNLEALRLKFSLGMTGNGESTKYIENPGEEYDDPAQLVDGAFRSARKFVIETLRNLKGPCFGGRTAIKISVLGYSDPRPLSDKAIYDGPDTDPAITGEAIHSGEQMTNEKLSLLRAYFSLLLLKQELETEPEFAEYADRIVWSTEGRGIDETPREKNELKRKVIIKIGLGEK